MSPIDAFRGPVTGPEASVIKRPPLSRSASETAGFPLTPERSIFKSEEEIFLTMKDAADAALESVASISKEEVMAKLTRDEEEVLTVRKAADRKKAERKSAEEQTKVEANLTEFERIYRKEATADQLFSQIDKMTDDKGLPRLTETPQLQLTPEEATSFGTNAELQKRILQELQKEADQLVKSTTKREKLMAGLSATEGRIAAAWGELSGTMKTQDIYQALRTKMLVRILQEKESAKVFFSDHGINHLDWDTSVACKLAADMGLPPLEQLYIDFAVDLHDIGYTLPGVAKQIQKGAFGIDKDHRLDGAKMVTEFWSKDLYKGLFRNVGDFATMHDMVLNHDQVTKLNIRDTAEFGNVRARGCLIAADIAAIWQEDKLPGAVVEAPDIFTLALYKIKLAKENWTRFDKKGNPIKDQQRFDLNQTLEQIQQEARKKVDEKYADDIQLRDELLLNIEQLNVLSPEFIPGRFKAMVKPSDAYGYDEASGEVYFRFAEVVVYDDLMGHPQGELLWGESFQKQQEKLLTEFGLDESQLPQALGRGYNDLADGQVRLYFDRDKKIAHETKFGKEARHKMTQMRLENQVYITCNEAIRSLEAAKDHPDHILNKLRNDPNEWFYHKLTMLVPDKLKLDDKYLNRQELITYLENPQNQQALENALYDRRGLLAEWFINTFN